MILFDHPLKLKEQRIGGIFDQSEMVFGKAMEANAVYIFSSLMPMHCTATLACTLMRVIKTMVSIPQFR